MVEAEAEAKLNATHPGAHWVLATQSLEQLIPLAISLFSGSSEKETIFSVGGIVAG